MFDVQMITSHGWLISSLRVGEHNGSRVRLVSRPGTSYIHDTVQSIVLAVTAQNADASHPGRRPHRSGATTPPSAMFTENDYT